MPAFRRTVAYLVLIFTAHTFSATPIAAQPASCLPSVLFDAGQPSLVGVVQRHVSVADLNGDRVPDLVVSTESTLVIMTGALNGSASIAYTPVHIFNAGSEPTGSVIADFNGDGILDIAVAALGGGLYPYRGLGSNGVGNADFAPYGPLQTPSIWDVAAGDVTGDGITDLVLGTTAGSFMVFRGTGTNGIGDGGFVRLRDITSKGSIKGVILADLDLDCVLDIVGATEGPFMVVHKGLTMGGTPNGDFGPVITVPASGHTYDVAVADFNRDGVPDLASADFDGHSVSVALGAGGLTFLPPILHAVYGEPLGIAVGDFNHDGLPDLVAAAATSGHAFNFLPNSGNFLVNGDGFANAFAYGPPRTGYGIAVADLNHDGSLDVVVPCIAELDIIAALAHCANSREALITQVVGLGCVQRGPDSPDYLRGTDVQLTAQPAAHWSFTRWSGDASGTQNPITVTMDRSKAVTARFDAEVPVATLASLVSSEAAADHIGLTWYVNDPGLPATLYRRTLDRDWSKLASLNADGRGFMRYLDTDITRGETYGYRLGIRGMGGEAYFAETYVLAEDARFAIEGVAPDPALDGRMTVRFTLPSEAPATIELLDVTGRRVDQRTLSGRTGRQSVDLGYAERLAPGLYWVRLRSGGLEGLIRAVVLK